MIHYSANFSDGVLDFMEGALPPFSPLILRLLGGACAAIIFIAYSPYDAPVFLWVIGAILCILPAIYRSILDFGDEERLSDAIKTIKIDSKGIGFWQGIGFVIFFLLLCALRAAYWFIMYAILGGIVWIVSIIFS